MTASCPASVRGIQDIHHRDTETRRSGGEVSIPMLLDAACPPAGEAGPVGPAMTQFN